jgi:5'-3' exonuclease
MGIPSFYRQLCRKFKHILSNRLPERVQWLCLDFNCGMYGCLHSMRPYDGTETWERDFCNAIASYMEDIVSLVKPTDGVFIACDGVVCAAKRRQQRLRRFKGPWMSASEAYFKGVGSQGAKWDQNALTPGTAFMKKLNEILVESGKCLAQRTGLEVIVSTTAEPGEGEHKLMTQMRRIRPESCMIYGLDADLLLLSLMLMAETGADVYLLREAQEFERTVSHDEEAVQWKTLSIRAMANAMNLGSSPGIPIEDFVATMSLLGNDFLPRNLMRTIREDGIPQLLETLMHICSTGKRVVVNGKIQKDSLLILFREWAATEESDMLNAARRALRDRYYTPRCDPDELPLKEWQSLPGRWATLAVLLQDDKKDSLLRHDWRDVYRSWHTGTPDEFCKGIAWTLDYYSGKPVDYAWVFDHHLPPLWSDVLTYLETPATECSLSPPSIVYPEPLPEWLHLLAVLPAESVAHLLPPRVQMCMAKEPLYWPTRWSLFDIGRSQIWECEPMIPIIPETILRSWSSIY